MGITTIDWSNAGFLRTYTMAFGASAILTVILWLVAVVKRALQGVHPAQAIGESIGYLLMSVMVSAFAPLAVAYVTEVVDGLAGAMLAPAAGDMAKLGPILGAALAALVVIPGGAIIAIMLGLFLLMAALGVWLELIVRNALIYVGLVFGPTVFSGLVDRDLWGHTKRWIGIMVGIIFAPYVTFTALALASGLLAGKSSDKASVAQAFGTVLTALALFFLALYLPLQIAKFIPVLGDQLQEVFSSRKQMEGGLKDLAGEAKSSFGEIQSRVGGGKGGGGGGGLDIGEGEGEDAAGAEAAEPGVGLAKAAADKTIDEAQGAAQRGVDGATAGTADDQSGGSAGSEPGGPGGAGDQSSADSGGVAPAAGDGGPGNASTAPSEGSVAGGPSSGDSWSDGSPVDEPPDEDEDDSTSSS